MHFFGAYRNTYMHGYTLSFLKFNHPAFGSPDCFRDQTRSSSDASRECRYGFKGKEKDFEIENDQFGFGFRELDTRLGHFISIDPLYYKYPSCAPFAYAMNRPIGGIDIEGKEWCSQHKWGDVITVEEHIKLLGENYTFGMTYRDAYSILAPKLAEKREKDGTKFNCADFTIDVMVEFAFMFKLPVHFEDYKPYRKTNDPTFDNDNGGYYDRDRRWQAIQDGDWQALSKAIQQDDTSYDIWVSNNNLLKILLKHITLK